MKKRKLFFIGLILNVIQIILLYAAFSFVIYDINSSDWGFWSRFTYVILVFIFSIGIGAYIEDVRTGRIK